MTEKMLEMVSITSLEVQREITDEDMLDLIMKQAKQRQDSIEQFTNAGRTDLAEKEAVELVVLQDYLPKALTEEELEKVVNSIIAKTGAESMKDMGKVMGAMTAGYKGRFDGKALSSLVRSKLA